MSQVAHLEIIELLEEILNTLNDRSSKSDNPSELFFNRQCEIAKVILIILFWGF